MIQEQHIPMLIDVIPGSVSLMTAEEIANAPTYEERRVTCLVVADFLQQYCDDRQLSKIIQSLRHENEIITVNNKQIPVFPLNCNDIANIVAKFGTKELRERAQKYLRLHKIHKRNNRKTRSKRKKVEVYNMINKAFFLNFLLGRENN